MIHVEVQKMVTVIWIHGHPSAHFLKSPIWRRERVIIHALTSACIQTRFMSVCDSLTFEIFATPQPRLIPDNIRLIFSNTESVFLYHLRQMSCPQEMSWNLYFCRLRGIFG